MEDEYVEKEGYDYLFKPSCCLECEGACCRGESGYIWVRYGEIERISSFLEMDLKDFAKIYLRKVGHRFSLRERKIAENDFACIFFDEKSCGCAIYPVRPRQCIAFPFWEQFKNNSEEVKKECPGVFLK